LFGISGAVAGGVFDTISPAQVAQARSLIAAILLLAYATYRKALRPTGAWWKLALLGLNLALVNVTFYWAIDLLGVGPGATVQFLAPILVLVWVAVVQREHIGPFAWVAAAAAVFGVGLVTEAWTVGTSDLTGFGAGLASAVLFATYLIYGEHLGTEFKPATVGAWGFVFASAFWAVVLPWWTFPFSSASEVGLELLIIGVVGTAVPFVLEFGALAMTSSGVVGIVATAEPPIAAVAAAALLDQRLEPVQWTGIIIVALAVAAVQRWGLGPAHETTPVV
jgi:inner membrane transporter RhtA